MLRSTILILVFIFALAFMVSCSGGDGNVVAPDPVGTPDAIGAPDEGGRDVVAEAEKPGTTVCLGLWQFVADEATGSVELFPLRSADKILNVLGFMEPPPFSLMDLDWPNLNIDFANGTVDVGIILTHPKKSGFFTGFDVRGVVFGPEVTNADGLTVIPSPEFFSGVPFGYKDGLLGTPDSYANYEGLAGYKYFCDDLEPDDDLAEFFSNPANLAYRGKFAPNHTLQRNFNLSWNNVEHNFMVFNYAIYANYDWPVGIAPWYVDDWDISTANSAEAFCSSATELANTLYYAEGAGGGDISLQVEVWDWQGDISEVTIESVEAGVIAETSYDATAGGGTAKSDIYEFNDVPGTPTSTDDFDILITVTDAKTFGECWFSGLLPPGNAMYDEAVYNCWIYTAQVASAHIAVLTPNGGEEWAVGSDQEITWDSAGVSGTVFIEYSKDNFVSDIHSIATDEPSDGGYDWLNIPEDPSGSVRVRVSSTDDPNIYDVSDEDFGIGAWIKVLTPNGGEEWLIESDQQVTWDSAGVPGTVFIEYSKDNFVSDIHSIATDEPNDGSYDWLNIPEDPSDTVRVRVTSTNEPGIYDVSNEDFSISAWIKVLTPNGGEEWLIGSSHDITWDSAGVPGTVFLEYSKDNFVSDIHTIATDEPNDGSFLWQSIPNDPSTTVRVRVSSTDIPSIFDTSDADLWIKPWITVLTPNGGEEWLIGTSHNITWDSTGLTGTVFLEYSKDNFVSDIHTIATDEPNDGDYTWQSIPDDPSDTVRVRVSSTDIPGVFDISDADFRIKLWIELLIPNGGEEWASGSSHEITWASGGPGTVFIEYSKDNFISDVNTIAVDVPDDGSFMWNYIPYDPSETVRVRVSFTNEPAMFDISDADFTLLAGWARTWGSGGFWDFDHGNGVAVDDSGNIYVVDTSNSLRKYDSNGDLQWSCGTGGMPYSVAVDDAGNAYVVGAGGFLRKYDSNGDLKWVRTWTGGAGYGVAVDDSGNAYVAETTAGSVFLRKYDSNGDLQWVCSGGGKEAGGVAVDDSGNAYVTGKTAGNYDAFLTKFNSNGDLQWAKTWGAAMIVDWGNGVAVDGFSNVYVTGRFGGTVDFDPGPGIDEHASKGGWDIFLNKFDSNGDFQWARTWGGEYLDRGFGVAPDNSGNVYVTGYFKSTVDFDPGPGTDWLTSNGDSDVFVSKFDLNGDFQWARTWGHFGDDYGYGVAVDDFDNAYATGSFWHTVDFDPGPGTDYHACGGDCPFLIKLLPDGYW